MSELFIELMSEEIPASLQAWGEARLANSMLALLAENDLGGEVAAVWSTPRRLAIALREVADIRQPRTIEIRGPRTTANAETITKFAEAQGFTVPDLKTKATDKGEFYFAVRTEKAQATPNLLPSIVNQMLAEFNWPKSQRWGNSEVAWVRPLHRIHVIFAGKAVAGRYDLIEGGGGGEYIKYGDATLGHPYGAASDIRLTGRTDLSEHYYRMLQARHVIASRGARRRMIGEQIAKIASENKLKLVEDPGLMDEVIGLVEYPHAILGEIDEDFMDLPRDILILAMRSQQKYFALAKADGKLAPAFITISNMMGNAKRDATIREGNERVLRARLNDARFLWDEDQQKSLADYVEQLSGMTYIEGSNMQECTQRIREIAGRLAKAAKLDVKAADAAASFAKADLTTGTVDAFPALQGIIGGLLARKEGMAEAVAVAIADHYKPLGVNDSIPSSHLGQVVALADKIDRLQSFFAIGKKPTGSGDPFGLRRAAFGIISIILEGEGEVDLSWLTDEVQDYMADRLRIFCQDSGLAHDCIRGVVTTDRLATLGIRRAVNRIQRLQTFANSNGGQGFLQAYKRIASILADEAKKTKGKEAVDYGKADNKAFADKETKPRENAAEAALYASLGKIKIALRHEDDGTALRELSEAQIQVNINQFFDVVKVNDDDAGLRNNRLAMLAEIHEVCAGFADFTAIEMTANTPGGEQGYA